MNVEPTRATLGALITDVDLSPLDAGTWSQIEAAFLEYGLLIFPGQQISEAAQTSLAERFGKIEQLAPDRSVISISNQRPDGATLDQDDHIMHVLQGNEQWHTDSTYMPLAAKAGMLSAKVVPSSGGGTEWADMRAAYDALDEAMRARIENLSAYHSLHHSHAKLGHKAESGASYGFHDGDPPLRPLVKRHPVTGRRALCIGRHAYGIPGLQAEESEQLLEELVRFACQPPRTYLHQWQVGDLAIWDNRCLLHRARPYDYTELRSLNATRIAGDPASES